MMRSAVGFFAHTGWAAAVVVDAEGRVHDRRRVELADGPAAVYHLGMEMKLPEAEKLIEKTRRTAQRMAAAAIGKAAAVGVIGSASRLPDSLEAILAAHPFVHAAEGELFRRALLDAAGARGLLVPPAAARDAALQIERPVGPPWAQDQKLAAAAAWIALTSR